MTPRPSSPNSLLASHEPSLQENSIHDDEKEMDIQNDATKTPGADDDELLSSSTSSPVETAYSRPTPRRRTFGSAAPISNNGNDSDDKNDDDPTFSQIMSASISNHMDDNAKPKCRPWELEEEAEEEASGDTKEDDLLLDSEESDILAPLQEKTSTLDEGAVSSSKDDDDNNGPANKNVNLDGGKAKEDDDDEEKKDEAANKSKTAKVATEKDNKKGKKQTPKSQQPDHEDLIMSIDNLFCEADKETVTVRDITVSLEAEYDVAFSKATKKIVRNHLVDLITGTVKPSVGNNNSNEEEDHESNKESELSGDESSEFSEEEPLSEYEDDEETNKARRRPLNNNSLKAKGSKAAKAKTKSSTSTRRKSTRKPKKSKKGSIHAHAEKLRQKRMQELRVRNEELQLQQSKEDRIRAELIAAKFETNTDDLKLQRLEDRLDLLQKLDQKRLQIIEVEDFALEQQIKLEEEEAAAEVEDSESDDDMELEIVGATGDSTKPLFPSLAEIPRKSTALSVLDLADKASPMAKQKKNPSEKQSFLANFTKNKPQLSPNRNGNARALLRTQLLMKQRKMGNMWLARELGYKNEKDHLRDCFEAEKKKRDMVLQREALRLAGNERTQLRERLRQPEVEDEEAEAELEIDENASDAKTMAGEEEDEEMALAKQMEQEQEDAAEHAAVEERDPDAGKSSDILSDFIEPSQSDEKVEDVALETTPGVREEFTGATTAPPSSTDDHNRGESQDEFFTDAQPLDGPVDMDMDTAMDGPSETTETQPSLGVGFRSELPPSSKLVDEGDDNDETQQFETQAPFAGPSMCTEEDSQSKNDDLNDTSGTSKSIENDNKMESETQPSEADDIVDTDDEQEFDDQEFDDQKENEDTTAEEPKKDRNAAWKAMLDSEARKLKAMKKRKGGSDFLETEADEEEEEEVAGLEDFGFSVHKKKDKDDDDDIGDDEIDADDLKHVVDDISDDEGDEETGDKMRRAMALKEEKERHKEMLRRMREGYDGRRGGIAGGSGGARGIHRFDELVAADNREAAKQLGLLNDDEVDSDDEEKGEKKEDAEEEDEAALLDKMLKDRFLHRSSVELEENFSDDEDEGENNECNENKDDEGDDQEQERLAKRFAKRARMQRLIDEYGHEEEFADSLLIEEDTNMKEELKCMKNGLSRKRSITSVSTSSAAPTCSRHSSISTESNSGNSKSDQLSGSSKRPKTTTTPGSIFGGSFLASTGSLSLALQSSRQHSKNRTSFLGNSQSSGSAVVSSGSQDVGIASQKSISFSHVVFQSCGGGDSQLSSRCGVGGSQLSNSQKSFGQSNSKLGLGGRSVGGPRRPSTTSRTSTSLWSKVMATGPQKRR